MIKALVIIILFCLNTLYSYTALATVQTHPRELKIQIDYRIETVKGMKMKLDLPVRSRLIYIQSSTHGALEMFRNGNSVTIENLDKASNAAVTVLYTMPVGEGDFFLENWLVKTSLEGSVTVTYSVPDGFKCLVIPYEKKDLNGYVVSDRENPTLVCARFNRDELDSEGKKLEMFYQFKSGVRTAEVLAMFRQYEKLLFPVPQKNIFLIHGSSMRDTVRFTGDNLFIVVNNTSPDSVKRALLSAWTRGMLRQNSDTAFALGDLYRRLLDDNGGMAADDAVLVAVPPRKYYEKVLQSGFVKTGEWEVDTDALLRNFALLHLAYYTAGLPAFQDAMRVSFKNYLETSDTAYNIFSGLTNTGRSPGTTALVVERLLPLGRYYPDLAVKKQTVYRSQDWIPDLKVRADSSLLDLSWGGKRGVDLGTVSGPLEIDPERFIPQVNFYNDTSYAGTVYEQEEREAYTAAVSHRHYKDESFREVIGGFRLSAVEANAYGIGAGEPVYVFVIKVAAPIRGKYMNALKEVFLVRKNQKFTVFLDRIRY